MMMSWEKDYISLNKMQRVEILFYVFFVLVFCSTGIASASEKAGMLKWRFETGGNSDATVGRALSLRDLSVGETAARHESLYKTSIVIYQTSRLPGKHI